MIPGLPGLASSFENQSDESPQLWNVFRGEMSLVGPRPALPREVKNYTSYDRQRLQMIPGCTGLWQVSGRNSVGFEEMVELDLTYARERKDDGGYQNYLQNVQGAGRFEGCVLKHDSGFEVA